MHDALTSLDLYWMGYFRADGCISRGIKAKFSQKVREPVEAFARYCGGQAEDVLDLTWDRRLPRRDHKESTTQHVFYSNKIGRWYTELGVKYGKLPNRLLESRHFWRGFIDGDGCVSIGKTGYVQLGACGSVEDMADFSRFLGEHTDVTPKVYVCGSKPIVQVQVAGDRAKFVCRLLYLGEYSALPYKKARADQVCAMAYSFPHKVALYPGIENRLQ